MINNVSRFPETPKSGGRLTNGDSFEIALFQPEDAGLVAEFHAATIRALGVYEKSFMLPKEEKYFREHLERGEGNTVIGIKSQGQIIAQSVILHPTVAHPDTGMVDMAPVANPESVSVMQAVSVAPDYRGNGLMDKMVAHWLDHAEKNGRDHLLAEVDIHNEASWKNFLIGGLNIVGLGTDPDDGTIVYNVYQTLGYAREKMLSGIFNKASSIYTQSCLATDLTAQNELFSNGHECVGYDRAESKLYFLKPQRDFI